MNKYRMAAAAVLACAAPHAAAHGFGQRFDLPLTLWLWVSGAGATIVLTFVVVALFVRERSVGEGYPRVDLLRIGALAWLAHPAVVALARLLGVLLFVLTVCAGYFGVQDPYSNLITTMVWIMWWVGLAFVCALVGDLWALANPLRTLFAWAEALYAALSGGRRLSRELPYPAWLAAWPAVLLFLAFSWSELIWQDNDVPGYLARALLGYALHTWAEGHRKRRERWLQQGEAFAVAFGTLARFAPLDAGRGRFELRPPGAGLLISRAVHPSYMVFVLLMLSTVTFDGFHETPLMQRVYTVAQSSPGIASLLFSLSEMGLDESQLVASAALAVFPLGFIAFYWLASWAMVRVTRREASVTAAACSFVLTLVPIAVAYHLSHYFSLLLTAGQFIIPLASDPFGFGWDLFGTAKYKVDLAIVSPYVFWYGAVLLIVVGHVVAVWLAHVEALRFFRSREAALKSQIPMVVLMVAYTTLSLWILAQPIVG